MLFCLGYFSIFIQFRLTADVLYVYPDSNLFLLHIEEIDEHLSSFILWIYGTRRYNCIIHAQTKGNVYSTCGYCSAEQIIITDIFGSRACYCDYLTSSHAMPVVNMYIYMINGV